MYLPRIRHLVETLRDGTLHEGEAYDHHHLAKYICRVNNLAEGEFGWRGISPNQLVAGTWLGMNVVQIRELFLPHTIKKSWDDITAEEVATVVEDMMTSERVRWYIVTPTHAEKGSLSLGGKVHDPKYLQQVQHGLED